jgi:hypothetical protein
VIACGIDPGTRNNTIVAVGMVPPGGPELLHVVTGGERWCRRCAPDIWVVEQPQQDGLTRIPPGPWHALQRTYQRTLRALAAQGAPVLTPTANRIRLDVAGYTPRDCGNADTFALQYLRGLWPRAGRPYGVLIGDHTRDAALAALWGLRLLGFVLPGAE